MYSSTLFIFYFLENVFWDGWSFVFFTSTIFIAFNKAELSAIAGELQWLIPPLFGMQDMISNWYFFENNNLEKTISS